MVDRGIIRLVTVDELRASVFGETDTRRGIIGLVRGLADLYREADPNSAGVERLSVALEASAEDLAFAIIRGTSQHHPKRDARANDNPKHK